MNFEFFIPVKFIFGRDKILEINKYIEKGNVLIITEKIFNDLGFINKIKSLIKEKVFIFDNVKPNPPIEIINDAVNFFKDENIKTVIGLGGGSSLDSAKAIACLLSNDNEYDFSNYLNDSIAFEKRSVKLIAIPTTSGTGSEATNVGVYTDTKLSIKKPYVNDFFYPDISLLDPQFTDSMPKRVTAITGLDALTHAIEAYWAIGTQNISESLSIKSIELIYKNLNKSIHEKNNKEAKDNMMLSSMIAGMSFSQTRTTASHAISFPLTNIYGIDHGLACALTLPELIIYTYENIQEKMDYLLYILKLDNINEFCLWIKDTMKKADLSLSLREYGIKKKDIDNIADISLKAKIIDLTPKKINKSNLIDLLNKIY